MKAVWTVGAQAVTLADDVAGTRMKVEQLGGAGMEQLEPLAFADVAFRTMRGNLSGDCVFVARRSHATRDVASIYFKAEYARVGQVGVLVLTVDVATLTMAGATLRGVVVADFNGVEWTLRYTFGIGTIL